LVYLSSGVGSSEDVQYELLTFWKSKVDLYCI